MNLISLTSSEKKSDPTPTKKTIYRIVPNMYISKKTGKINQHCWKSV